MSLFFSFISRFIVFVCILIIILFHIDRRRLQDVADCNCKRIYRIHGELTFACQRESQFAFMSIGWDSVVNFLYSSDFNSDVSSIPSSSPSSSPAGSLFSSSSSLSSSSFAVGNDDRFLLVGVSEDPLLYTTFTGQTGVGIEYDNEDSNEDSVLKHDGGTSIDKDIDRPDDSNLLAQDEVESISRNNNLVYDMFVEISEGLLTAFANNSLEVDFDAEKKNNDADIAINFDLETAMAGSASLVFNESTILLEPLIERDNHTLRATIAPSDQPSLTPSVLPSGDPSMSPSTFPSFTPSLKPSDQPSISTLPTLNPSVQPSLSFNPSESPSTSFLPTTRYNPSSIPSLSLAPSVQPSELPSHQPSLRPTEEPSLAPSMLPSKIPSFLPSNLPSLHPSVIPSQSPSISPSLEPSPSPSSVPSLIPSASPSINPSSTPTSIPTSVPSLMPSISIDFEGIIDTYSLYKGELSVTFERPELVGVLDLDFLTYDLFVVVVESRDSTKTDFDQSIPSLIDVFDAVDNSGSYFRHHIVASDLPQNILAVQLPESMHGKIVDVFMSANYDGTYSTNTGSSRLHVSNDNPLFKDSVNVVGLFVPIPNNLTITVDDILPSDSSSDHFVNFTGGPFTSETEGLQPGDYIIGFDSEYFKSFLRYVVEKVESSSSQLVYRVRGARMTELYETLDLSASLSVSRRGTNDADAEADTFSSVPEGQDRVASVIGASWQEEASIDRYLARVSRDLGKKIEYEKQDVYFDDLVTLAMDLSLSLSIQIKESILVHADMKLESDYSGESDYATEYESSRRGRFLQKRRCPSCFR